MPAPSHLLRWSTEMLPERARFSTLREEFARQNLALDVIDHSGGRPRIDITYVVRSTNDRRNLVYPFYVIPREEDQ